jgi:hypothetical protein
LHVGTADEQQVSVPIGDRAQLAEGPGQMASHAALCRRIPAGTWHSDEAAEPAQQGTDVAPKSHTSYEPGTHASAGHAGAVVVDVDEEVLTVVVCVACPPDPLPSPTAALSPHPATADSAKRKIPRRRRKRLARLAPPRRRKHAATMAAGMRAG